MEHESESVTERASDSEVQNGHSGGEPPGCGKIILWLIVGGIVVFLAAVAFVFGACLLA